MVKAALITYNFNLVKVTLKPDPFTDMTTNEGGEDHEIDTEALQARIDLVMSRVHEMATSWLSPSLKSTGRVQDTEKIIQEQLRRPPR
jgi:hypothetical protein